MFQYSHYVQPSVSDATLSFTNPTANATTEAVFNFSNPCMSLSNETQLQISVPDLPYGINQLQYLASCKVFVNDILQTAAKCILDPLVKNIVRITSAFSSLTLAQRKAPYILVKVTNWVAPFYIATSGPFRINFYHQNFTSETNYLQQQASLPIVKGIRPDVNLQTTVLKKVDATTYNLVIEFSSQAITWSNFLVIYVLDLPKNFAQTQDSYLVTATSLSPLDTTSYLAGPILTMTSFNPSINRMTLGGYLGAPALKTGIRLEFKNLKTDILAFDSYFTFRIQSQPAPNIGTIFFDSQNIPIKSS